MLAEETKKPSQLALAVLNPVIFLDSFDYPATAYEIRHYLDRNFSLVEVFSGLEELEAVGILQESQGFYFLLGRRDIINIRQARYNYSCAKLKIARRFSRLFSLFPGVVAIAAANFIGRHNLRAGSDIDFFMITKPGMIWLSRLYCAGLAKLLNRRPTSKEKKDKICLSFYITANNLDISKLALPEGDPYFYYWQRGLVPLYDHKFIWDKFLQANKLCSSRIYISEVSLESSSKNNFLERAAKIFQLKIMAKELLRANNNSDGVIISDDILKLYLGDRRRQFAVIFNDKKNEIIKAIN